MRRALSILSGQQFGLVIIILLLGIAMTLKARSHVDPVSGHMVNNFLNAGNLFEVATDASFFAIMAVGETMVIISAGIDLSVGSVYALAADDRWRWRLRAWNFSSPRSSRCSSA